MKNTFTFLLMLALNGCTLCPAQTPIGIKQNSFTTNGDAYCVNLVSTIASVVALGDPFYTVTGSGEPQCDGNYYQTILPVYGGVLCYTNGNGANFFLIGLPYPFFNGWGFLANLNEFITTGNIYPYYVNTNYVNASGLSGQWVSPDSADIYQAYPGAPPYPFSVLGFTGPQRFVTAATLAAAGGLTVSNYANYVDVAGAASMAYPPISNPNLATQVQLSGASNGFISSLQSYAPPTATAIANGVYSNNPSHYISYVGTNATKFGSNVVTSMSAGTGVTLASNLTSAGWAYTVNLAGSNVVYITNINAVNLAAWGAFTTNKSSWLGTLAAKGDWTNAAVYFSGIISTSTAAATLLPKGVYLTGTSNLNYTKFTNPPVIPSVAGFTTAAVTNPLASMAWVSNQNYLQSVNLSFYSMTGDVASALSGYPTNLQLTTNALQLQVNTNATNILLCWGTNHAFVGAINVNSNMTASYSTNGSGVITATLGSTTNLYTSGYQPATKNLTNWSAVATNSILLTTNLVTKIVQGNNVLITFITNKTGINATVNAYYAYNAPVQFEGASVTFVNNSPSGYKVSGASYSHPLPAPGTSYKVYSASSPYTDLTSSFNSFFGSSITNTANGINAGFVAGTPSPYVQNIIIVGVCQ